MITIAAGDIGDYLFLVIMLVFGLINWVANKIKEGKEAQKPPPREARTPARPISSAPPTRDAEEERMRRFLEALGVPQDDAPPAAPPPLPPKPVAPPPPVVTRTAPPPLPREEPSFDEADTADEPVEPIRLPEFRPTAVREFQTASSRVSADDDGDFVTVSSTVSATPAYSHHAPEGARAPAEPRLDSSALLAKLRSRADVRTALVLSEILGPPRALRAERSF